MEITDLSANNPKMKALEASMSPDELRILNTVRARQVIRSEDTLNIENFTTDTINGMAPKLERGSLTLVKAEPKKKKAVAPDAMAALTGQAGKLEEEAIKKGSYVSPLEESKPSDDAATISAAAWFDDAISDEDWCFSSLLSFSILHGHGTIFMSLELLVNTSYLHWAHRFISVQKPALPEIIQT